LALMGRFRTADGPPAPYSEVAPDRCAPPRGARFLVPGEDKPRECGIDPDMPPSGRPPHYERPVNLGFAGVKRRG
jgi:hypothetical protein